MEKALLRRVLKTSKSLVNNQTICHFIIKLTSFLEEITKIGAGCLMSLLILHSSRENEFKCKIDGCPSVGQDFQEAKKLLQHK